MHLEGRPQYPLISDFVERFMPEIAQRTSISSLMKETVLGLVEPQVRGDRRSPVTLIAALLFDHHPVRLQDWICE